MKYLGQWEERCESVIDELERLPGVLCVDRLLDLIRLGGSGPNDSLAAFLMPFLQRGELRLVSEATPAEAAACRRLLPGLVDLFPMVEVPALNRTQALAVLDRSLQRHGQDLRLEIAPGVSDRIYHLFRRFQPYQAFPGPAVQLVRELCERQARRHIANVSPENAVEQFVRRTGLPDWLLRDEVMLEADYLLAEFHDQVIGQDEAVQAAARVVTTFKAGLNDPRRPLGVLLFCGPTGVGKTELARTLAHILFSHGSDESEPSTSIRRPSEDRLLRLDMSEYAGPDAVSRLIGNTYGEPSPLIRRLRQQPCCVVLFDEIEKAGPEVFDVLLSICDEGRLTDTFGRTTTFCSSVIIMTSNLGSTQREAFGLNQSGPPSYSDIAAGFFRPEFFNRLDAVVTFQPLGQDTILMIARKELAAIARREGFVRAGLQLSWSERLVTWLAREGFDARHGARPLQRVLEQKVVALLARYLLANPELREARVEVDCDERGEVEIGKGRGG